MYGGGGNGGDQARQDEMVRQAKMDVGMAKINKAYSGFDDNFYKERENSYEASVLPILEKQYRETGNNLSLSLARSGLLNSSAATQRRKSLAEEGNTQRQNVANKAVDQSNQLRSEVENQRQSLVGQLTASGDPTTISSSALSTAQNLKAPSPVGNIGSFFRDWSEVYLANQSAQANDPTVQPMFSFGGNNQSSVIVN